MTSTSSTSGTAGSMASQAMDMGEKAMEAVGDAGSAVTQTAREYPITTAVMIAGVAFALGALWKSGSWRRRSSMHGYMDRMGEMMADLPRRMRSEWR